eukprot:10751932-Alexandrium_andersonii.AAC.1
MCIRDSSCLVYAVPPVHSPATSATRRLPTAAWPTSAQLGDRRGGATAAAMALARGSARA